MVFIHQVEKQEEIRCLNAETGEEIWKHAYAVEVAQSYGITDQPRSSPVIDPGTKYVYTLGNDGDLLCLQLDDGKVVWKMRLEEKFGPSPFFFGYGSSPLVYGERLIVQVGSEEHCVAANVAGKSNAPSVGFRTSEDLLQGTNSIIVSSRDSLISPA